MFVKYKIPYFCVIFDRHSNYMLMFCLDDGQILIFISSFDNSNFKFFDLSSLTKYVCNS